MPITQDMGNTQPDTNPIFIQALWRSGSTYIWRKFREEDHLLCFAKPFHHSLSKSKVELQRDFEKAAPRFGFQNIEKSYYSEYKAGKNGVPGYDWRFSIEQYAPYSKDTLPEMKTYLSSLINQAHASDQRPMFQFNRGVLRAKWLDDTFSATSLYVSRSPEKMIQSYKRLASERVAYYMACYLGLLGTNANQGVFQEMGNYVGIKPKDAKNFREHFMFYNRMANSLTDEKAQDIVGFFWALGIVNATSYASDCLDMELGNEQGQAAAETFSNIVQRTTGENIDFYDLSTNTPQANILKISPEAQRITKQAISHLEIGHNSWEQRLDNFTLADSTRQQLTAIIG